MSDTSITPAQLSELEAQRAEIVERKAVIDTEIANIRDQLDAAKSRELLGQFVDPLWVQRASCAMKHKGRDSQQMQQALGELTRRIRVENAKRIDTFGLLRNAAARVLPADMFDNVMQEFHASRNAAQ